jgi:hypothetical protein
MHYAKVVLYGYNSETEFPVFTLNFHHTVLWTSRSIAGTIPAGGPCNFPAQQRNYNHFQKLLGHMQF